MEDFARLTFLAPLLSPCVMLLLVGLEAEGLGDVQQDIDRKSVYVHVPGLPASK